MSRTVCVVTGSRAEYGLLYWLMKEIDADSSLELQVVATGSHLSPSLGMTVQEIERDFTIDRKIEILLASDSPIAVSKSMGLTQISFAEAFEALQPDMIVVLGDRYEIFSVVSTALICGIPVVHLHGGELTFGAVDDAIRHSITKMSHLHFTANETYRQRVIQLGESPENVFNVGGLGLDNIMRLSLLDRLSLEAFIGLSLERKTMLVTYHPLTIEQHEGESKLQFQNLLEVIDELSEYNVIFTKANADTGGCVINHMIDTFVSQHSERMVVFSSLGQLRYLSALKFVSVVVGNSSSGIIEAPAFQVPTINIGDRQLGRLRAKSVIDCRGDTEAIRKAFMILNDEGFCESLKDVYNPYGDGGASIKIKNVIKTVKLANINRKTFFDVKLDKEYK